MTASEGFPPAFRLRRRSEFGAVMRRQQKSAGPHVVLLMAPRPDGTARLGVMISKRIHKHSVRRHQLKRWVVELFRRELRTILPAVDVLVLFRRDPPREGHAMLDREIRGLIERALSAKALWGRGHRRRRS
jgi:ribonuclease P protein component